MRSKVPVQDRLTELVGARFSKAEKKQIAALVKLTGRTATELVRAAVIDKYFAS
jgi:hypothetical protein